MKDVVFSKELLERAIATESELKEAKEKGALHLINQEGVAVLFSEYKGHIYILDVKQ